MMLLGGFYILFFVTCLENVVFALALHEIRIAVIIRVVLKCVLN